MKFFVLLASVFLFGTSKENCKRKNAELLFKKCYKGKLEIKAGCMNYTISIQSNNFDAGIVQSEWKDESTGKVYKNVFGLKSRCNFPDSINQGDEFYFTIDSANVQNCMVCLMYYPTPEKKLFIKVLNQPCTTTTIQPFNNPTIQQFNHSTIQPQTLNPLASPSPHRKFIC